MIDYQIKAPIRVGLVGTGYAAQRRAEAFQASPHAQLVALSGHTIAKTATFSQTYNVDKVCSWQDLVADPTLDLICICTINQEHSAIARAALLAKKHVVVEYPLALSAAEGEELARLARQEQKLLHVEHIEILGDLHQTIREYLPRIGKPFFARYATIVPKNPAPLTWTYNYQQYGFPLIAALSRIHRFTDLFGNVESVSCQANFWDAAAPGYFSSCLCQAQLKFSDNLIATITYGKGENFASGDRTLAIYGEGGTLTFTGSRGLLKTGEGEISLELANQTGLFAKDTNIVLDHLFKQKPLYVENASSCYALKVAHAAFKSYQTGRTVEIL